MDFESHRVSGIKLVSIDCYVLSFGLGLLNEVASLWAHDAGYCQTCVSGLILSTLRADMGLQSVVIVCC